ncbi:FAD/NAD(P)-binding protein [Streptomyces niveus]|uniref:FAD/NAD(P)-binding protein n=1 Tax=Streptomyces niveus TaxID=193462 RepID=A0ABZ2A6N0_STRNV|nr:FAD/NAD(P)-binding protein [Streptomyces niveus]
MRVRAMDIAIVGGGAAAVGLLDALAGRTGRTGAINVFEPSAQLWRGRPYGPDLDAVRVNAPPANMSIRAGDSGHYSAWLGTRSTEYVDELLGEPLIPRALYGDYLAHTAEKAVASLAEQGRQVRVVAARVTGIDRAGGRPVLRTDGAHGQEYEVGQVALCLGGGVPQDLYGLAGQPDFIADPYPLAAALDHVPPESDVTVIGSGLTAVDVVVSLAARGHQGRITLVSRGGVLPFVRQRANGRRPRHVTTERVAQLHQAQGRLTLDDLISLLRTELAEAGEDFDTLTAELLGAGGAADPVRRLREQLAAVDDPHIGRRVLQQTAHTVGPCAWPLLGASDQGRLRRHLRTAVGLASPMVPMNASVLMRLLDSGQLTFASGLRAIERTGGRGFRVRDDDGVRTASLVVNA